MAGMPTLHQKSGHWIMDFGFACGFGFGLGPGVSGGFGLAVGFSFAFGFGFATGLGFAFWTLPFGIFGVQKVPINIRE